MNYKTIPLIIAGILSVMLVAAIAYVLMPESSGPSTTNTPGGSDLGGYSDTVTAANPGGSTPAQQAVPEIDLQTAYDTLFAKLLARRVTFARIVSGDVYALYANDVAKSKEWYPSQTDFSLGIAMEDITDDGAAEALVLDDLPGSCGVAGCPLTIYQKTGGAWKSIFAAQIQSELGLANVITNGHIDLMLVQQGNWSSYQTAVSRYIWDGQKYDFKELVAAWNGTGFTVYGQ